MFHLVVIVILTPVIEFAPSGWALRRNPIFTQDRIVGGKPVTIEEYPYQVSLQYFGRHFCGGSIISENVILTAAHCTSGYSASRIAVRVGSSRHASGGIIHNVTKVVQHKDFKSSRQDVPQNDIAVLHLLTSIEFNSRAQAVPLFNEGEELSAGTLSTISGWGTLRENGRTLPDVLYATNVPIISKEVCTRAYRYLGGIPDGQICAAHTQGGKDTCQGDSGGPLVINGRQAGIVSWGNGCARRSYPGVYTEIAGYRDFIFKHAGV